MSANRQWTISIAGTPAVTTLVSPQGQISSATPLYVWNAVSDATWYQLKVDDDTGSVILKWYTAAQAGCNAGTGQCSVKPVTSITGNGSWSIQTYNSSGNGPWSSAMNFSVQGGVPDAATLVSPSGSGVANPVYTWNAVPASTWYYLWVDDSTGTNFRKWYTASAAGCSGGTCRITGPSTVGGNVTWWQRAVEQ